MEIRVKTAKARQSYRRPTVVGYRWEGNVEMEMLACGHSRPVEGVQCEFTEEEWDEIDVGWLAEQPSRRPCKECPVPKGWDR